MPRIITEAEVRANIAQIISQAANGEEFLISRGDAPGVKLMPALPAMNGGIERNREEAITAIQVLRRNRKEPAASIEEIIAWRDEGRK